MTSKEALRLIQKSVGEHGWFGYEEINIILSDLDKLETIKKILPNMLATAIQCGYGVEHTGNVERQEKNIINEILLKLNKENKNEKTTGYKHIK